MEQDAKGIRYQSEHFATVQGIMHYVNVQSLMEEHRKQNKRKATGIDGVDKRNMTATRRKRHGIRNLVEAHLLDEEMLEEIRFLLNYWMDSENSLALILSVQSELWNRMKTQAYRVIRYRIDVECFMELFDFRPQKNLRLFLRAARMINRACTLSLSLAYQTKRLIVDDRMVSEALEEEVT